MSAVPQSGLRLEAMQEADLDAVAAIEADVYSHPWTRQNFVDSLRAGYTCRVLREEGAIVGYLVLAAAAGEAHLLNLSVAAPHQRRGHGTRLLEEATRLARRQGARHLFLEVRPSNAPAQRLYARAGFRCVSVRRGYYPARTDREDALVLVLTL